MEKNHTSSFNAFFFYGIAMYKQKEYILAIAAFQKAEVVNDCDA